MSEGTVDSSEYIPISKIGSIPVITFCPRQGVDSKMLTGLGYRESLYGIGDILAGTDLLYSQ